MPVCYNIQSLGLSSGAENIVEEFMDANLYELIAFLDHPFDVFTIPGSDNLTVPIYNGKPSLLLAGINNPKYHFTDGQYDLGGVIYATSGSGKTRSIFECLSKIFGLYFVGQTPDGHSGGSKDFASFKAHVEKRYNFEFKAASRDCNRMAEEEVNRLISTRIAMLRYCQKNVPRFTPYKWLLVQFADILCFRLYAKILASNCKFDYELIEKFNGPIFVDEAQSSVSFMDNHFLTAREMENDNKMDSNDGRVWFTNDSKINF
jgi:hypothetical protein